MTEQEAPVSELEALFNPVVVTEDPNRFVKMGWLDLGYEIKPLYEALQDLSFHQEFQLDLETTGLGSFRHEKPLSMQLGVPGKQYVFDLESIKLSEKGTFDRLLKAARVIGHNLAFDLPYLFHSRVIPKMYFDTILAEQLCYLGLIPTEARSKSLGAVLKRHLGIDMDKSLQATINQGLNTVEDVLYAARDVWPLKELEEAMMPRVRQLGLYKRLALENRYLPVNAYLEVFGPYVDQGRLKRWVRRVESEAYLQEVYMEETYGELNWNSPQQVAEILKQHGIEEYNEETGNATTSDDVLQHRTEPIAQDLRKLRKANKLLSTYGRKWFYYIMDDGRIHTKYKQLMETGRTSSGDVDRKKYDPYDFEYRCEKPFPNMQNLPRSKEFRACFSAAPGNVLVVCDYSSQESVILADQSEEPALLRFFLEGTGDMHSYVTRLIWPELADLTDEEIKEHHSEKRTLAKTCFSPDTEVLTPDGWRLISEVKIGDTVMQGTPGHDKAVALAWAPVLDTVDQPNPFDHLIGIKNKGVDILVTPDHKMLSYTGTSGAGVPIVETAESLYGSSSRLLVSGGHLTASEQPDDFLIRLAVATQADGSYNGRRIRFGFAKKRKVDRLLELLRPGEYTEKQSPDGYSTHITLTPELSDRIKALLDGKQFSWRTLAWDIHARGVFVDELQYWDGHVDQRYGKGSFTFDSVDQQSIDVAQAVCSTLGYKATQLKPYQRPQHGRRPNLRLSVRPHNHTRTDQDHFTRKEYTGNVVCVTVPSGFLLVRRNAKTLVVGNCGFAIAYGGNGDTIVANIGCDRETGWHVYNRYMEVFSGLPAYFKKCFAFAWQNMYMPTDDLTGGKRFFDNAVKFKQTQSNDALWARYMQLKQEGGEAYEVAKEKMKPHFAMGAELKKQSVNTKIQGTAAVMSKLAGVYFFEWIVEKGLFGKVTLPIFVHDEWVAECPKKMGEEVAAKLQECMERAGKLCLKHLTIKALPVICTHWEK